MINSANSGFKIEMRRQAQNPSQYDPVKLADAQAAIASQVAAIEAATTHDELNML